MKEPKYFSVMGDSISTLLGYNPDGYAVYYDAVQGRCADIYSPEDTWWGMVIKALGGRLLVNNSFSGSTVCSHPAYEIESYASSDTRTAALHTEGKDPDVVMILMGINDFGLGFSTEQFEREYRSMLEKIRHRYQAAEIWCLTLPKCENERRRDVQMSDFCSAIRRSAEELGCRAFDICSPAKEYITLDGYHPTREGMIAIADEIIAASDR